MALTYQPPGVNITEIVGTTVSPLLATPTTVCIVGLASGAINRVEQVVLQDGDADNDPLTPDAPVPISFVSVPVDGVLIGVTEVRDVFTGTVYAVGTDYTIDANEKTITRVNGGAIPNGTVVRVYLSYRPSNYFTPQRFNSVQEIEERFGSAWNAEGTGIGSPVSHAALMALENGASFVVVAPLYSESGGVRSQPTPAQAVTVGTWQSTLLGLRDYEDINMVVPVIGQVDSEDNTLDVSNATVLSVFSAVQDHVWFMRSQDQYVIAVLGEDSSNGVEVSSTTLINHANSLSARYGGDVSDSIVLLSPAKYIRSSVASNQTMYVGGQYAAAAFAGRLASIRVEDSLTRKPLGGIIQVAETRTKEEKNAEASAGLCVIEQRGAIVRVRHALTLDRASEARSELNVVRAKHFMLESLYNTFEQQVIGQVVADNEAPEVIRSTTIASLERLKSLGIFSRYRAVDVRFLANTPTHVEVRFSYLPRFAINFVNIIFSIDFTEQSVTNVVPGAGR